MRKKIFLIIILLAIPFLAFGQRPLEVEYPTTLEGEAPTTVETTSISQYVRYVYNISFGIAAVIAFAAFIYAGFLYLSSAGDPNKMREAKSRMFSALLGVGILLISYVLLVAINPETIMLITPRLEDIPSSSYVPDIDQLRSEYLGTVKEIGIIGGLAIEGIGDVGENIFESSLQCLCFNAGALCLCTGGSDNDSCEPEMCYAGRDSSSHPCSNYDEIREWEELLVFYLDELIHYQNRAVGTDLLRAANLEAAADEIIGNILENVISGNLDDILDDPVNVALAGFLGGEAKSLQKDILDIINPTIDYYENYLAALPPETDPRTIDSLNDMIEKKNDEFNLKQDLVGELIRFSLFVEAIKLPIAEISDLTEQCALNAQEQCEPECFSFDVFGGDECHDTMTGCQAICVGLNPCPIIEIGIAWLEFDILQEVLEDSAEEITALVDEIRELD